MSLTEEKHSQSLASEKGPARMETSGPLAVQIYVS